MTTENVQTTEKDITKIKEENTAAILQAANATDIKDTIGGIHHLKALKKGL